MPVDFFKRKFIDKTDEKEFGLCDDSTAGVTKPAYLDVDDRKKWIAIVKNEPQYEVEFYPIDGCLTWKRTDGSISGRCDGMLSFSDMKNIIFVELKYRELHNKDWRTHGKSQLIETLEKFFSIYDKTKFQRVEAYLCNKQQLLHQRYTAFEQNFKNETGIILRVKRVIDL
ncbi:MAG: hypothetical protein IKP73_13105 [Bacteroidales bacterium]|nr:hypothetical protein [Bacteroidales bacterium]MBR4326454.1 hypothetical protein [Bacteroidales bacterium]